MASTYTDLLRLEKQGSGENDSTWGTKANTVFDLIDVAIAGRAAVTHDDAANYTLTTANSAADEARNAILNIAGALTAARNVVVPTKSKVYLVKNATTGGFDFTLKTSAGTGIVVPNGKILLLFCDGTNVVNPIDTVYALSALGAISFNTTSAVNESITTVASGATPDIWTSRGNVIDYTGTGTATGFAAAPQAGARRTLICAGAAIFTAGANMLIEGVTSGSDFTAAAGDQVAVTAVTTTQFRLSMKRYNGAAIDEDHWDFALSDETTAITTGTAKLSWYTPYAMTLTSIPYAWLTTVSSSGLPTVDINEAGTTILGVNKLSIDANELTSGTAATATTLADTALAAQALITFDIDVAGTGAKGLKVRLFGRRT